MSALRKVERGKRLYFWRNFGPIWQLILVFVGALAAACLAFAALSMAASATASERAPECVTIRAVNPDATVIHLTLCGSGPGRESPLHGWAQGRTVTVDGAYLRGQGCGHQADPCVMLALRSPQS